MASIAYKINGSVFITENNLSITKAVNNIKKENIGVEILRKEIDLDKSYYNAWILLSSQTTT
jgi:hypothetical protein